MTPTYLPERRSCEKCGQGFQPRDRGTPQRFCSPHCRTAAYQDKLRRPKLPPKRCLMCDKLFDPRNHSGGKVQVMCSLACRKKSRLRPVVTKQCLMCGQDFETFRDNQKMCGPVCGKASTKWHQTLLLERHPDKKKRWREKTKLWVKAHTVNRRTNCRWCNAEIVGRRSAVYCNQRCMWARKKSMSPEEWTRALTEVRQESRIKKTRPAECFECLWCGDNFEGLPGDVYCSEDCQTEDAIERMKEAS